MIRCNSEADSTVWMKEEKTIFIVVTMLWNVYRSRFFYFCMNISIKKYPERFCSGYFFILQSRKNLLLIAKIHPNSLKKFLEGINQ